MERYGNNEIVCVYEFSGNWGEMGANHDPDDMPEIEATDETGFALSMMDLVWGV